MCSGLRLTTKHLSRTAARRCSACPTYSDDMKDANCKGVYPQSSTSARRSSWRSTDLPGLALASRVPERAVMNWLGALLPEFPCWRLGIFNAKACVPTILYAEVLAAYTTTDSYNIHTYIPYCVQECIAVKFMTCLSVPKYASARSWRSAMPTGSRKAFARRMT